MTWLGAIYSLKNEVWFDLVPNDDGDRRESRSACRTFVPKDSDGDNVNRDSRESLLTQPTAGPGAGKHAFRCRCLTWASESSVIRSDPSSDKHRLGNSIRSFLAVKRQEVTGGIK